MKQTLLILATFLVYASSGIFTKAAGAREFLSMAYMLCLAAAVGVLGLYAVLWQRVLGVVELSRAFLFKSVTVVYAMIFAVLIFDEALTVPNLLGTLMIIAGITLLVWRR